MNALHIKLVEAVNDAKTQQEHDRAEAVLQGFRTALDAIFGRDGVGLIDCDRHYIDQVIDRPMCAGVFLDWKPADAS